MNTKFPSASAAPGMCDSSLVPWGSSPDLPPLIYLIQGALSPILLAMLLMNWTTLFPEHSGTFPPPGLCSICSLSLNTTHPPPWVCSHHLLWSPHREWLSSSQFGFITLLYHLYIMSCISLTSLPALSSVVNLRRSMFYSVLILLFKPMLPCSVQHFYGC